MKNDESGLEISIKLATASNVCGCICGWKDQEDHSYNIKSVDEDLTLFEDKLKSVVTVLGKIFQYFK